MSPTKRKRTNTTPGTPETPWIPSIPQRGLPSTVKRRMRLIQNENPQRAYRHLSTQYPLNNNNAMYNTSLYTFTNNHSNTRTIAHTKKKQRHTSPLKLSPVKSPILNVSPARLTLNRKRTPNNNTSQAAYKHFVRISAHMHKKLNGINQIKEG